MIEISGLTKRYGAKVAVDDLTFTVRPGHVTGFLGPNGAGKSTTAKLGVRDRVQVVIYAYEHGVVRPGGP
nr:ATP-binding cassette domain-containing protein [Jiangella asiatica]